MCTQPRTVVPYAYYEVTSGCIEELSIFKDEQMKIYFLEQLAISLKAFSFRCLSWSLMDGTITWLSSPAMSQSQNSCSGSTR